MLYRLLNKELPYSIEMDIKRLQSCRTLSDLFSSVFNLQIVIMDHVALSADDKVILIRWLSNLQFTLDKDDFR